eukprot:5939412-Prymnesium_polylepis.1
MFCLSFVARNARPRECPRGIPSRVSGATRPCAEAFLVQSKVNSRVEGKLMSPRRPPPLRCAVRNHSG